LTKTRDEVYDKFRELRQEAELQSGRILKICRSDNAKEFQKLAKLFPDVQFEYTAPYTPEQNGVAERLNRTLITTARALLGAAKLPKYLWGEAVYTACYLRNRTIREGFSKTPEELFTGRKPLGAHLRVFGCLAYITVPEHRRTDKLGAIAEKAIFVGYETSSRQYRVYIPKEKTIRVTSSIRFDETTKGGDILAGTEPNDQYELPAPSTESVFELEDNEGPGNNSINNESESDNNIEVNYPRRSGRERRPPNRLIGELEQQTVRRVDFEPSTITPKTYKEATTGPQASKWSAAIQSELDSLRKNNTWTIVDKPEGVNLISPKWVFKIKWLPNGQIDKYKARLVARGFTQQHGVNYDETFSPVMRLESLRILLAVAVLRGLLIHQMDVVLAYLIGELDEEVYLLIPEGIDIENKENKALRLNKTLYGLKQSGRVWNKTMTGYLKEIGLQPIPADPSVFINNTGSIIVALYVDDLLLFAREEEELLKVKRALTDRFDIKDLGEVKHILGIEVQKGQDGSITLSQRHYIEDTIREFDTKETMIGGRRITTPTNGYTDLLPPDSTTRDPEPSTNIREYQTIIGKLNWVARGTRADTAFAIGKLSQFLVNPTKRHLGGATRVLRYLNTTKDCAIRYSPQGNNDIVGYSDADYAGDIKTRRSTTGYLFTLAGGPITWVSKIQRSVATSTTEAEYIALSQAAKEAIWIRRFLEQIRYYTDKKQEPTTIYGDNQSSIALVKNLEFHSKTKHIDIGIHYVREQYEDSQISVSYIPTTEMLADCLTKPIGRQRLERTVSMLGYTSNNSLRSHMK
jgi:hypothetical protein